MSGIKDTATVTLNVNGAQAKQMMADLEAKIKKAEANLTNLQNSMADPKAVEKARKQLKTYQKQLDEMKSATEGVTKALDNLDKATPRDLEKALRTLNRQLKDMTPGSYVWDSHVEKIKELKKRLAELREEVKVQETLWDKFKNWINDSGAAIVAIGLGIDQAIGALREYVDAFASMEQEMANVRKFTGMTEEQVASLNERFKEIDTRSSREQLNMLAQEAGRLGKTSEEDVLGFVRAADQINVALDDLGEGATLTLSKLTGIFGDEARYGTEQSLLKVGSVINELSQNCSASAPYLSQFAERMGGVGAQAGLTIQQIMGFGAVLDSNAQKVEASATALSQIIVRLYQDPAKYAKVAGIDVQKFSKLMREDANAAVLLFLETLHKSGGMDNLSPMFKDMGENGSRAIAALSTLATHIDQVKAQQEAANIAFEEGTSVTTEFNVQNNTVQANLDKCKNKANELRVELGQRLYPIMSHFLTTGAAIMRLLLNLVRYMEENKATVIALALSIAAWTVALNANIIATKLWTVATKVAAVTGKALRMAVLACSTIFYTLTGNIQKATAATRALNIAMKGNLFGIIATAIALVIAKLIDYTTKAKEAADAQEELRKEQEEWRKGLKNIDRQSEEYAQKELARLDLLYKAATDDTKSKKERIAAVNELKKQYPDYFSKLSTEQIMLGQAKQAYDDLTTAIIKSANARAAYDKIAELGSQKLDENAKLKENQRKKSDLEAKRKAKQAEVQKAWDNMQANASIDAKQSPEWHKWHNQYEKLKKERDEIDKQLKEVNANITEANSRLNEIAQAQTDLAEEYGVDINAALAGESETPTVPELPQNPQYVSAILSAKEKKKAELEAKRELAKAKAEFKQLMESAQVDYEADSAKNVMDYGAGLKSYEDYITEKERLDLAYLDKRIELYKTLYKGESDQEKKLLLMYDEDYQEFLLKRAELANKQRSASAKRDIEEYTRQFNMNVAKKQFEYASPFHKLYGDTEAQEEELHRMRINFLLECRNAYDKNTKEYADYQRQIESAEQDFILDRRKQLMQKYEQWVNQYTTISAERRYEIELGIVEKLYEQRKISEEQYQLWLAQLREKYNSESSASTSAATKSKYTVAGPGGDVDIRSDSEQIKARVSDLSKKRDSAIDELKKRLDGGLITQEEYNEGVKKIEKAYEKNLFDPVRSMLDEQTRMLFDLGVAWADFFKSISENGELSFDNIKDVAAASLATMCAGLQTYSQFVEAEKRIELAAVEKRYDREIKMAQGNSYKVAKAEKKKEDEIAKVKAEYAKKEFAIKVIMAVAQTAQNALLGYAAGLQAGFPMATWLAPLLAGMAVAQGAIQIALLKKQQQAAAAEGYSEGGFTKKGGVNEPAGIVHAGEWVASQKLLANPVARPMIDALDYAQRTNTIGSLRADDVSRSITANNSLVRIAESDEGSALMTAVAAEMSRTVSNLTDRLREPFVTIATVTGDKGIKQAQDDYTKLMNNVTPKSKRKTS